MTYTICTEHHYIVRDEDRGSCPQCRGDRNLVAFVESTESTCRLPHLLCCDRDCSYYSVLASIHCVRCRTWTEAIEMAAKLIVDRPMRRVTGSFGVEARSMKDTELSEHIRTIKCPSGQTSTGTR